MRAIFATDEVTLTTSTVTLLQVLAATDRPAKIAEVSVSFKGTNNLGEPILVQLLRQTTAGTASVCTPAKGSDSDANAIQVSGQKNFTVEPTASDVLEQWEVHPQQGLHHVVLSPDLLSAKGGNRIGLRVVTPGAGVKCVATIKVDE